MDGKTACVWVVAFDDPQIWEERNADPAIYLHRIATNPDFRGRNLVVEIVKWAKILALQSGMHFVRLDTVGENTGLINYYKKCGFNFLGLRQLNDTTGLPAHYHNAVVSLFELVI